MKEIELEKTFLVKRLPSDLVNAVTCDLLDIYIPSNVMHPVLRIRKRNDKLSITKKIPIDNTYSEFTEETIALSDAEYLELSQLSGKRLHKKRYTYRFNKTNIDLDVFLDELAGLVLVDFEFADVADKESFTAPDWCLCDVTREEFIAGGWLAGKKFGDIENSLIAFGYNKIKESP